MEKADNTLLDRDDIEEGFDNLNMADDEKEMVKELESGGWRRE